MVISTFVGCRDAGSLSWEGSCFFARSELGVNVAEQNDVWVPFFNRVRHAARRVLLLDYDGTLAPFTSDRTRAFPYREIPELVSKIMRHNTRVVLVSGRAATELLFLSGIQPQPEIWGSHGAEWLHPDGAYEVHTPDLPHRHALHRASRALQECGLKERMESKPSAVAVHWRGLSADRRAHIEQKVRAVCVPIAEDSGLELLPFDGGVELRAPGRTKGDAVNVVLTEAGEGVRRPHRRERVSRHQRKGTCGSGTVRV